MAKADEIYWTSCDQGHLRLQQCDACTAWQFPPVTRCTACLGPDLTWREVAGTGRLWSWVRFHKQYFAEGPDVPYLVAMVELDEGIRMTAALLDEDGYRATQTSARCGDPVKLAFRPSSDDGRRLPLFRVVE